MNEPAHRQKNYTTKKQHLTNERTSSQAEKLHDQKTTPYQWTNQLTGRKITRPKNNTLPMSELAHRQKNYTTKKQRLTNERTSSQAEKLHYQKTTPYQWTNQLTGRKITRPKNNTLPMSELAHRQKNYTTKKQHLINERTSSQAEKLHDQKTTPYQCAN